VAQETGYKDVMDKSVSLTQLFLIFFKMGAFTIGGGYAMIPLIEKELTKRGWISEEDLQDIVVLAQSAPGLLAVNMAIYSGYLDERQHRTPASEIEETDYEESCKQLPKQKTHHFLLLLNMAIPDATEMVTRIIHIGDTFMNATVKRVAAAISHAHHVLHPDLAILAAGTRIRATATGLTPWNMLAITLLSLNEVNAMAMASMITNDGSTAPTEATMLPFRPASL